MKREPIFFQRYGQIINVIKTCIGECSFLLWSKVYLKVGISGVTFLMYILPFIVAVGFP